VVTSSATGAGLDELATGLFRLVELRSAVPDEDAREPMSDHRVYRPVPATRASFEIEPLGEGAWRVSGDGVERLVARHDLQNEDALAHIEHRLRRMGVVRALEDHGFEPGDDVEIAGVTFELDP
jgi:GTP-binding protein